MQELNIRAFRPTDIFIGFNECLSALSETQLTLLEAKKLSSQRVDAGIKTVVVLLNGVIVGTGAVFIEKKFAHNGGKAAHIEDVAVHKSYQGQGIGKLVVNKLIEIAERAKVYKVILNCSDENIGFYNKFGFTQSGHLLRKDLI